MARKQNLFLPSSTLACFLLAYSSVCLTGQVNDPPSKATQGPDATADDLYKIGGDVSPPTITFSVEPRIPDAARRVRLNANVLVNMYVNRDGKPLSVRALRTTYADRKWHPISDPVGSDITKVLEKSALEAVQQYRFRPAMKNGQPVRVELNIQVPFQIY